MKPWRGAVLWPVLAISTASTGQTRLEMDFEGGVQIQEAADGARATLLTAGRPWVPPMNLQGMPTIGAPTIQFEGGTPAQRSARIVSDPLRPGNHVLEFRIAESNVVVNGSDGRRKSRVQMNLYGNSGAHEFYLSAWLYLDPGMAGLRQFPRAFNWLTLAEFWNGAPWTGDAHPFRITVNIVKTEPAVGGALQLAVRAEAMRSGRRDFRDAEIWQGVDVGGALPFGQWMRLEYWVREGNEDTGRFALAVTPQGQPRRVVFDLKRATLHPDARAREGFRHVNPLKLYTSEALTDHLARKGEQLRVLWDDLVFEACLPAQGPGPSSCSTRWAGR
jgi:hypothetical protein